MTTECEQAVWKYTNDGQETLEKVRREIEQAKKEIIREIQNAPTQVALKEALRLLSKDMHAASNRPCQTCNLVSNLLGEPFGCNTRK